MDRNHREISFMQCVNSISGFMNLESFRLPLKACGNAVSHHSGFGKQDCLVVARRLPVVTLSLIRWPESFLFDMAALSEALKQSHSKVGKYAN